LDNNTRPQVSVSVGSPTTVLATTGYNYPVISGGLAVLVLAVAAISVLIRNRRRKVLGTIM
jgi:cell division protein FtsW (lipid II flippase)